MIADADGIVDLLAAGRSELSPVRSRRLLESAAKKAREWGAATGEPFAQVLESEAIKELSLCESNAVTRAQYWRKALGVLERKGKLNADNYASLAVDAFQDVYADIEWSERQSILRRAKGHLDHAISEAASPVDLSVLLARKSSVLRHISLGDTADNRLRILRQAHRCSNKALDFKETQPALLECALAEWKLAGYEKSDVRHVERLRRAEEILRNPDLATHEPAVFALPTFYRLNSRPLDACEHFPQSLNSVKNPRRLLRGSVTYAEAATQLWYGNFPSSVTDPHISASTKLLEEAIAAGYSDARTIVDLAFVRAISDGPHAGLTALQEIKLDQQHISWPETLRVIAEANQEDLPTLAFALGVGSSSTVARLGTFAGRFLEDPQLAEALYRSAIRTNPRNAIALTNLARLLVSRGGSAELVEAKRLLQKAQNFADRRFVWWRDVLREIRATERRDLREGGTRESVSSSTQPGATLESIGSIRTRYRYVSGLEDAQRRGYELEQLIYQLAHLSFGTAAPSYRFVRPLSDKVHQVDAYFEDSRGNQYRCECKWRSKPATYDDIAKLIDTIDVVRVSGFFVSMAGFDQRAIDKAREVRQKTAIILCDGREIDRVISGSLNFDELITRKRVHFDQRSEPYYVVEVPSSQD